MIATVYEADPGMIWVRKDNLDWELGQVLYLAPEDDIDNYMQVEPKPEEAQE